jgi:microcystin degradation protein MlrC
LKTTKMIDQKWQDINGRKHKLYVVRSMGASRGFGVIEVLCNFVVTTGSTREECYEYLRNTDER